MYFRQPFFTAAVVCALAMASACATTGTVNSTLVDTDKALIVADTAYHATEQIALAAAPGMSPATKVKVGALNDRAAAALHTAYTARTSAAVALAVEAIALFSTAAKGN